MVKIGIISERRKKGRTVLFPRWTKEEIKSSKNPFVMMVFCIPYDIDTLTKFKESRRNRLFLKAKKFLQDLGAEIILFSDPLKELLTESEKAEYRKKRDEKVLRVFPRCIRQLSKEHNLTLPVQRICIRTDKTDIITEYLLRELVFDTKEMYIVTDNEQNTSGLCEEFFNETGLMVKVLDEKNKKYCDIDISTVPPRLRIGRNLVIEGMKIDFELGDLEIDSMEIAAYLKDFDAEKSISSYVLSKKKLTL